jgi:roadblock/LC7 domain-containing protein
MKNLFVFSLLFLFAISTGSPVLATPGSGMPPRGEIYTKVGGLKIPFIKHEPPNGDNTVKFSAATAAATIFVENGALTYLVAKKSEPKAGWSLREKPLGSKATQVEGLAPSPTKVSFFKGKDPRNWRVALPAYEELTFGELYDHIRLNVKAHGNNVEKIFIVENGGDPEKIALQIEGAKKLSVNSEGELEIETGIGLFKMTAPIAYQEIDGRKVKVAAAYELKASEFQETDPRHVYGFKVGAYDKTKPLIIDPLPKPTATFLGGASEDRVTSIAIDARDHIYVIGYSKSSDFFTGETGPVELGNQGSMDVFVAKLSNDLKNLIAIAFVGGSGDDYGNAIAIDAEGNILITGYTLSPNFPTTPPDSPLFPPYDATHNGGADAFIAKLDGDLSSLIASTFLGGNNSDYGFSVAIGPRGNIYVSGWTLSAGTFPVTIGAYVSPSHGGEDLFVSKFDPALQSLLASSRFGGSNSDYAYSLTINQDNEDVYLTGTTASTDFPVTPMAFAVGPTGNLDVFVSRLDGDLSTLLSSTYLGGSEHDVARGIALSPTGDIFITGWTASNLDQMPRKKYPVTFGAFSENHSGNVDVFVSKLNSGLSTLLASSFLGGADGEQGNGIIIDATGNIYVTGWTSSNDFPVSEGAFDSTRNGNQDVFIAHLDKDLSTLLASTYIGGVSHDAANAIALDSTGMVFVAGYTNSFDLIPMQFDGGFDDSYADSWDAFVYRQRPDLSKIYLLSVLLPGEGNGTVISAPNGIKCGKCPAWDI